MRLSGRPTGRHLVHPSAQCAGVKGCTNNCNFLANQSLSAPARAGLAKLGQNTGRNAKHTLWAKIQQLAHVAKQFCNYPELILFILIVFFAHSQPQQQLELTSNSANHLQQGQTNQPIDTHTHIPTVYKCKPPPSLHLLLLLLLLLIYLSVPPSKIRQTITTIYTESFFELPTNTNKTFDL